jgi:uncharacterized protein DUF1214
LIQTAAATEWADLETAIGSAVDAVLGDGHVNNGLARHEGVRFLTRFMHAASTFEMEPDPAYPHLVRVFQPLSGNWFLPCPDGVYHYAVLDGRHDYRIRGRRGSAHLVVAEVFEGGFFDVPHMRVYDSRRDFDVAANGELEITLSQHESAKDWVKIPPGPSLVLLRQWFYDWDSEEQGEFLIERIGETYPAPPLSTADLDARWDRYLRFIRTAAVTMVRSVAAHYAAPPDRVPFPPIMAAVSASDDDDPYSMRGQVYGTGYYRCADDQAVILEVEPPVCEYWSFALYSQFWEVSDWLHRSTSINGHQAVIDDDGVFRAVISHRDPGVPNWLDAGSRPFGLIGGRYFATNSVPEPSLRTVPFNALRQELPAETPSVTTADRQETLRRRTDVLRRRFRP